MSQRIFLHLTSHHIQQEVINTSEPLKKQLWQQISKHKIKNQSLLLDRNQITSYMKLRPRKKRGNTSAAQAPLQFNFS